MKKRILLTGILAAAALSISACGGKSADTTAVSSSQAAESPDQSGAEESKEKKQEDGEMKTETEAAKTEASETVAGTLPTVAHTDPNVDPVDVVMNKEDVQTFAEDIQNIVAAKDLQGLMDYCAFPVYVTLAGEEGQLIDDSDVFLELNPDQLFSEKLMKAVAAVDVTRLTSTEAGVVVGDSTNITFSDVEGNLAITGINQ